jgi:hypothetical protein
MRVARILVKRKTKETEREERKNGQRETRTVGEETKNSVRGASVISCVRFAWTAATTSSRRFA